MYRNRKKSGWKTLGILDGVAKGAYDSGELSEDLYTTFVNAGLSDMRENTDCEKPWADEVVFLEPAVCAAVDEAPVVQCSSPAAEEAPAVSYEMQEDVVPEECKEEEWPVPEPSPAPDESRGFVKGKAGIVPYSSEERPSEASMEEIQSTTTEEAASKTDPRAKERENYGFLWCFGCGRVDAIMYGDRNFPSKSDRDEEHPICGIVLVLCGTCRDKQASYLSSRNLENLDDHLRSCLSEVQLMSQMFEGSDAVLTARAIQGREVSVLVEKGGAVYGDVGKLVKTLRPEDHLASVDVARFRSGQRDGLLLPYLRSGLLPY